MPIYTDDPCNDGVMSSPGFPLFSSLGVNPKITKAIDDATKDWLDEHPEATITVEDNSLTNAKFMDGSVNSRVIEDESITTDDIADLAITTPKIADGAVTTPKIADNSITSQKLANNAIDAMPTMSTAVRGVAKVGAGLAMNNGALELNGGSIAPAVTAWLNEHPEATTTVQDNSITDDMLVQNGGVLDSVKLDSLTTTDTPEFEVGAYVNLTVPEQTRQTGGNSQVAMTDYIALPNECFKVGIGGSNFNRAASFATFAFFDVEKAYISGVSVLSSDVAICEVPDSAAYVCFGNYNTASAHTGLSVTYYRYKVLHEISKKIGAIDELTNPTRDAVHPEMTAGQYINTSGVLVRNNNQSLSTSGFIEIPPSCVRIDAHLSRIANLFLWVSFYDEYKQYISGIAEWEDNLLDKYTDAIPSNAAYIRLCNISSGTNNNVPHDEVTYKFTTVRRITDIEKTLGVAIAMLESNAPDWSDKKWCVIGDSITEDNYRASEHYWSYISNVTGIEVANQGISGSGYLMYSPIVNRITADTFPTDCDVITMMAGVNDVAWATDYTIGDATDTGTSTLCGAVNAAIDALEVKYPVYLPLGIVTPLPACIQSDAFSDVVRPDQYPAVSDCKLGLFVEKIKEIAELRGYPCLDLFHTSGLQPQKAAVREALFKAGANYAADGLHPNADGHAKIQGRYLEFMKTIIQ